MERTKNKLYVASAVLQFVFASISALYVGILIFGIATGSLFEAIEADLLIQYGGDAALVAQEIEMMITFSIFMAVSMAISVAVMYIDGAFLLKYSNLTNEEAAASWGKCLAWVIVSYFFGGLLIGGLATGGLCSVHAKQKEAYLNGEGGLVEKEEKDDPLSPDNLENLRIKLSKIKELKESGAITEEEFTSLRNKIMHKEEPKVEEKVVDKETEKINKMTERLNKLNELKDSGAITEAEYANLKEKVLKDN